MWPYLTKEFKDDPVQKTASSFGFSPSSFRVASQISEEKLPQVSDIALKKCSENPLHIPLT